MPLQGCVSLRTAYFLIDRLVETATFPCGARMGTWPPALTVTQGQISARAALAESGGVRSGGSPSPAWGPNTSVHLLSPSSHSGG